jgi:hypothetical protein
LVLALCSVILLIPSANAQVSGDWNISDSFGGDLFPTPSPSPNPTVVSVFGNFWTAITMFSIIGFLSIISAIMVFVKGNDAGDGNQIGIMVGVLIIIGVGCLIAVAVTFAMQNAMTL